MRKLFVWLMIISFIFSLYSCSRSTTTDLEKEAKSCYKQLKKIETITSLDSVVCVASKRYDSNLKDTTTNLGFLFIFNDGEIAFYENGNYMGNGKNGGYATGDSKSFVNIGTLAAHIMYVEYLKDGSHLITLEDANNDSEGIILLDMNKIK